MKTTLQRKIEGKKANGWQWVGDIKRRTWLSLTRCAVKTKYRANWRTKTARLLYGKDRSHNDASIIWCLYDLSVVIVLCFCLILSSFTFCCCPLVVRVQIAGSDCIKSPVTRTRSELSSRLWPSLRPVLHVCARARETIPLVGGAQSLDKPPLQAVTSPAFLLFAFQLLPGIYAFKS